MAKRGLWLPEAGLWLDPWDRQDVAFISHPHSDHLAAHGTMICSKTTASLLATRFRGKYRTEGHMFGRKWTHNGYQLMLLPAGFTLGSAQIHLTRLSDGATLLYTGDFKLRNARTAESTRGEAADVMIMETTYGLPNFVFPSPTRVRNSLHRWCRETIDNGETPVLLGDAMGKAQEILAQLADSDFRFLLTKPVFEMTDAYAQHGVTFPRYAELKEESDPTGKVIIAPPNAIRSQSLRRIRRRRVAMCTGWALTAGARQRYQVDDVFPLSNHADYPELVQYVSLIEPKLVLTIHGFAAEFARDLRQRGFEAWTLGADDQMEFSLGLGDQETATDEEETVAPAPSIESGFGRFTHLCDAIAAAPNRSIKVERLAEYLRQIESASEVGLVVSWLCGKAATADEQKRLSVHSAVIRLALLSATTVGIQRFRALVANLNDLGRTAYLMLLHSRDAAPRSFTLEEIAARLQRLSEAKGPAAKAVILDACFRQLTPTEGSYLVKILTSDMRIGLQVALIEEAAALAFGVPLAIVREGNMLANDLSEVAQKASLGSLTAAALEVFKPIRPMRATWEETAEELWKNIVPFLQGESPLFLLEEKIPGIRCQLHKRGSRLELFAEDMREISPHFPEITGLVSQLADDVVIDGALVAWQGEHQWTAASLHRRQSRIARDLFLPDDPPPEFIAFDLLWHNGRTIVAQPLVQRRALLASLSLPAPLRLMNQQLIHSLREFKEALKSERWAQASGVVLKVAHSPYISGRPSESWRQISR